MCKRSLTLPSKCERLATMSSTILLLPSGQKYRRTLLMQEIFFDVFMFGCANVKLFFLAKKKKNMLIFYYYFESKFIFKLDFFFALSNTQLL